jgi:hypothetical protein
MHLKLSGLLLSLSISQISGCGGDALAQNGTEQTPITCDGFGASDINVFVRDSLNNDELINNATVKVISQNQDLMVAEEAFITLIEDEDGSTLTGAYYTPLSINAQSFEISLVELANGYHSFVTKGIEYESNTECKASNSVIYDVYLHPVGISCCELHDNS